MSGYGPILHAVIAGMLAIACTGNGLIAQDTNRAVSGDSVAVRILELERAVEDIRNSLEKKEQADELESLLKEADRLSMQEKEQDLDLSKKYFSGVRQQQGLNPNISFGMDFFGGVSSSKASSLSDPSDVYYGTNGFFLREAELSLVAPLDPFTRAKAFLSGSTSGIEVDEVYMEWLNLPLHLNLKAGVFKAEFGFLNRYHEHALPQFDRPRALVNLFGNDGLSGTGLAFNFMLPSWIAHASSLDFSLLYGRNAQSFLEEPDAGFMYAGQFLNYYDLSPGSYLEIRLSGAAGRNDLQAGDHLSLIGSAGLAYKWAPVGREKYRTLEWKTEFLYSSRETGEGNYRSKGFYSSLQNKLSSRLWLGGRVGYSELPYDPNQFEWDYTISLDFWQSEFVMTRFQYQYNRRHMEERMEVEGPVPSDHSFIIQVAWAMGPHKHEAY